MSTPESTLVVSAHAADFVWRAGQALEEIKALRRAEACSAAARRNAGPNLGLPQSTLAEAYMRVFPQVTDRLA